MTKDDFLKLMSQLESSGGKNLNHKPSVHGANPGDTAIGQYGLMPQTAYEVVHPTGGKIQTDPNMWQYNDLDKNQLAAEVAKNPDLEKAIAGQYADKVLNRAQSPEAASEAWLAGPNKIYSGDELNQMPRVQKFQQLRQALQNKTGPFSNPNRLPVSLPDNEEDDQ